MNQEQVGQWLRELRQRRGMTLRDLEDRSGVDRGSISRIENGKRGITWDMLETLVRAMGEAPAIVTQAELNALFTGEHEPSDARSVLMYAAALPRMSPSVRRLFERELEMILEESAPDRGL